MEMGSYWKQFEDSGKIQDYLSYKAMLSKEPYGHVHGQMAADVQEGMNRKDKEQQGAVPYAGFYECNRNDIKTERRR